MSDVASKIYNNNLQRYASYFLKKITDQKGFFFNHLVFFTFEKKIDANTIIKMHIILFASKQPSKNMNELYRKNDTKDDGLYWVILFVFLQPHHLHLVSLM